MVLSNNLYRLEYDFNQLKNIRVKNLGLRDVFFGEFVRFKQSKTTNFILFDNILIKTTYLNLKRGEVNFEVNVAHPKGDYLESLLSNGHFDDVKIFPRIISDGGELFEIIGFDVWFDESRFFN